jgi:nitroreductase/dihydropteridine reductase
LTYTSERIYEYVNLNNTIRKLPESATALVRDKLLDNFSKLSPDQHFHHAAKQTAIAMGFGLLAAALEGIDASPMEGFDPDEVDKIWGFRIWVWGVRPWWAWDIVMKKMTGW